LAFISKSSFSQKNGAAVKGLNVHISNTTEQFTQGLLHLKLNLVGHISA
jgi:hypothetical protein